MNRITFKPILLGVLISGFLTIFSMGVYGQETATIQGEVLDMSCYLGHGAKGDGHKTCAQMCLEKGLPAGILSEDGKVYLLLENHSKADAYAKVVEHAAEDVKVTGVVVNKGGVQGIVVEEVEVLEG